MHTCFPCILGTHTGAIVLPRSEGHLDELIAQMEAAAINGAKDGTVVAIGECGLDYERLHVRLCCR